MESAGAEGPRVVGGRYRLIEKVGSGGMGTVWRARDELLGRTVAVKEVHLPPQLPAVERAELRLRTMREARTAARLSHPNAVTVHDVIEEDGQPWIVMQLVAADSLAEVIEASGPVPPRRAAQIGLALLSALEAAHAEGILHRDVKPANVLLAHDGRVVLTDFGVATLEGDPALTGTGLLLGSPAYIAPERALGSATGPASDLWSLGATLYAAVEGHPPYDRDTPMATLTALTTEDAPEPRGAGPLAPAINGLLHRDPAHRLDGTAARQLLGQALTESVEQQTAGRSTLALPRLDGAGHAEVTRVVPRPDRDVRDARAAPSSHRWRWVAAALVVLAALGVGGVVAAMNLGEVPKPGPSTQPATPSMPAAFVGRWSGDIAETGGSKITSVSLQLYAGEIGAVVGASSYPKLGCSGELRLLSVTGDSKVRLAEKILVQGTTSKCTPTVAIDLMHVAGTLVFAGSDGFTGELSTGGPTG